MSQGIPLFLQGGGAIDYDAIELRKLIAALTGARHFVDLAPSTSPLVSAGGGHGVVGAGDMAVTAGTGMTVDVAKGLALVRGTQQETQGSYLTDNNAVQNLTISASDPTNPRKDLILSKVRDNELGIAGDDGPLVVLAGTPTGGLTAGNATGRPTPPENSLILAEVFVPAAAASSASYTITDLRTRANSLGGTFVCLNSAFYPNPASEGMEVIDLALGQKLTYSGAAWVAMGQYGAWTPFTPTVGGWALGNGTVAFTLHKIGRQVTVRGVLTVGSTTTFGAALTIAAPFAAAAQQQGLLGAYLDASAGVTGPLMVRVSGSTFSFYALSTVVQMNNAGLTSTVPVTWAAGDKVEIVSFTYEATS